MMSDETLIKFVDKKIKQCVSKLEIAKGFGAKIIYLPLEIGDIPFLTEIKTGLLRLAQLELLVAEQECICQDCEWYDNPGACPDYDESKCEFSGRGEI